MSDANKALAEVRGWLCDNLGSGDAGKVCGMLSVVSRRINELEDGNAKLRELADAVKEFVEDTHCEDCSCRRDCDDNNRIFCVNDFSYHAFAAMRELRAEVDG